MIRVSQFGGIKMSVNIPITLTEADIHSFGHTKYQNNGETRNILYPEDGTTFVLGGSARLEMIILRSLLTGLGYKMSRGEDFEWVPSDAKSGGKCDVIYYTDYPWSIYMK